MTESINNRTLKKVVESLVSQRNSKKKTDFEFEQGEFIQIPVQSGNSTENIALYIEKAKKDLPGNPIVLFTHGDGESIDDYLGYGSTFCPHGVSFCVMDYRGTGYSDGFLNASCALEKDDVITVIKYLKSTGFQKISYFGRSLGAICGVYAAAEFPDLVCIAFDSGSINIKWLTIYQLNHFYHINTEEVERLYPEACRVIKEIYGIDFSAIQEPYVLAPKITQPIFVIHGRKDQIVPISESERLMELVQSQEKQFVPFDGGHNDFSRYKYFIQQFLFILHHNGVDVTEDQLE